MSEFTNTNDVLAQATNWIESGDGVAIATVIATWGSSPRPVGSQLAINKNGSFVGSVSGGCIEGAVITEALTAISDGKHRILEFGVSNEQAWEVGLACGGDIKVLITRVEGSEYLFPLIKDQPIASIIDLSSGNKSYVTNSKATGSLDLTEKMLIKIRLALQHDQSQLYHENSTEIFIHVFNPPLRCAIIGAVHISQALAPMAEIAGFDVTIIDPRDSFATNSRFPNVKIINKWPDEALSELNIDARTAIITLTHDPKLDDPALHFGLKTDAFYIGCLGSRRTHSLRLERLTESGFETANFSRIKAPVGLDLGAKSPAEIATSILAEMIATKHGK
ncbi:MAG: XdhC family protein [Pseudomonadota bacterium]|nr:XdhC family protein [Pseudomonadota bacterium]